MTHEEILKALYDETLIGNAPEVKDLVNKGLADGLGCESMLYDALIFAPLLIERIVIGGRHKGSSMPTDVAPFSKRLSEVERGTTREHG